MTNKREMPTPPCRAELRDNPIKLCNEIGRLFRHRMRAMEGQEGVMSQPGAHLVLSTLAVFGELCQQELVEKTHLRAPTVSVILKQMENEGLVTRQASDTDKRMTRVCLTEAGQTLDRETIQRIRGLDDLALQGLKPEQIDLLMELLPMIRNNLLTMERKGKEGEDGGQ